MMESDACEKCGKPYEIGEWPFCPHGAPSSPFIDDTLPGGPRWMYNLGDERVWIGTKTEYNRELSSRGLVQAERRRYNRDDKSPWATPTRLKPGMHDPFIQRAPERTK